MIFKQVDKLRDGSKSQTRRVRHDDEAANRWHMDGEDDPRINEVLKRRKKPTPYGNTWITKYVVGKDYPVIPKMYQPAVKDIRIRILSIREEPVQAITEADAIAEGVGNVAEYTALWRTINTKKGTRWEDNPVCWVYEFEVIHQ